MAEVPHHIGMRLLVQWFVGILHALKMALAVFLDTRVATVATVLIMMVVRRAEENVLKLVPNANTILHAIRVALGRRSMQH
jgi:hypothetical protein